MGVAECDEYITMYEGCIDSVPPAGKDAMEEVLKDQLERFKATASTAEGKAALKNECKILIGAIAKNPLCK